MGATAGNAELIILVTALGYAVYLLKRRRAFTLPGGIVLSILLGSLAVTLLLEDVAVLKTETGPMTLGYAGLLFFALAFGETAGITAGIGLGAGEYLLRGDPNWAAASLIASMAAGGLAGFIGRGGEEFSTALLGAVLGGSVYVIFMYTYLRIVTGVGYSDALSMLAPVVSSVTTAVILGVGLLLTVRKWEKWPGPLEGS
ncbi:hypothetical protein [Thermococcus sp. Bubb.Bath]|uniref:hypothetical protein n=1 Tax=Thermococcus sp. Bubb.Bath TaxID=1638242 RepID=UPI0014387E1C|nr:hypothetical protein [Thermococcus sp. Bubb.Bath]NJF25852.1 hypothetical protein [Thermococcus sp. Bubb.Bath]